MLKITGIMPIRNGLKTHYPFLECIITTLPLVDEMIVVDGGSQDGTVEAIERLQKVYPRIKLIHYDQKPGKLWEGMDEALLATMKEATGDWIIEVQADEYYTPKDYKPLLELIKIAHYGGYNGIRQRRIDISRWGEEFSYVYRIIRIFRNLPNVRTKDGGDSFYFDGQPMARPGFTSHNLPPELDTDIPMYHLCNTFPVSGIAKSKEQVDFFCTLCQDRRVLFERFKGRMGISEDDFNIDNLEVSLYKFEKIHEAIPEIFHELAALTHYKIRDEIFSEKYRELYSDKIEI